MKTITNSFLALFLGVVVFGFAGIALAADFGGDNADYWYTEAIDSYPVENADYWYTEPYDNADYWYTEGDVNADYWYTSPESNADYWYTSPSGCDYYCGGSSYGCGSYCGGGYSSGLRPYSSGCGSYCGGSSYRPVTWYGSTPISISSPRYPSYPSYPVSGGGSTVVNNSNTNTNINNNSAVAIAYAAPQTPIVYTAPTPVTPVYPAPYCTINHAVASGSGIQAAYISWTSSNATTAYLSNSGNVSLSGSKTFWPTMTTTYTLTVYGQNGQTNTCSTTVVVNNYQPTTPYVSLTQIPYTGFDLGPVGNAMYWAGLVAFALSLGYVAVYYMPRMFAPVAYATRSYAPVVAAKAPILVEREEAEKAKIAPVVAAVRKAGTTDSMAIVQSKDGSMPKIVIARNY